MKTYQRWIGLILLALLCTPMGVIHAQEKTYSADRFESAVVIEDEGAILVTETIEFNFVGGPFTFVFRELPLGNTDGISIVRASVDGVVYPVGEDAGQVEIERGDPMRITWHFEPMSNVARSVQLVYRMEGVVRPENGTDALHWQPLPDSYDYAIGESETTITYPASATLIGEPMIEAGTATIEQSADQVTFTTQRLEPDTPLVVSMQFAEGSLISAPPAWFVQEQINAEHLPYWVGAALALFAAGLAGIVSFWRRNNVSLKNKGTVMSPPNDIAPGMAGALLTHGKPTWTHAQATLYSLAEQGVLIIEELPEKTWYRKHDFAVKLIDQNSGLRPHEEGLLTMLFGEKFERETSVKLSEVSKKITGKGWKQYEEPLQAELKQAGFMSDKRKRAQNVMLGVGTLFMVISILGIVVTVFWGESINYYAPLAVAFAFMGLAVGSFIFGAMLAPLSDAGAEMAVAWNQFSNYLKDISKGKQSVDSPTMFEKYLPHAASFGLLSQWTKHFEKAGWTELPPYVHVLPTTDSSQAWLTFVYMQGAFQSSGGSAAGGAGAAGAGAAGGGASGAG